MKHAQMIEAYSVIEAARSSPYGGGTAPKPDAVSPDTPLASFWRFAQSRRVEVPASMQRDCPIPTHAKLTAAMTARPVNSGWY